MLDLIAGRRRVGDVTNLAAAGVANAQPIMAISAGAQMLGVKTFKIRRLKIRSNAVGADTWVHIGTGVGGGWAELIPALRIVNNTTDDYDENDLPTQEFAATITSYPDAVGGGSLDVQVEVEEIG